MSKEIAPELITIVVKKLAGKIDPVGISQTDYQRLNNLDVLCKVVDDLITDIIAVSRFSNSNYASEKKIGDAAKKFLNQIVDEIKENQ